MSVAIIGNGAIGQMLAFSLASAGHNPLLYGRGGPIALTQTVLVNGQRHNLSLAGSSSHETPRLWLFATKAYDLVPALLQWRKAIPPASTLVLLCNGYVEPELSRERRGSEGFELMKGIVTRGARFNDDGSLVLSAKGEVRWGAKRPQKPAESLFFQDLASERFIWDEDVCARRKEKWYFNTVLNTLCGVYELARNHDVVTLHAEEYKSLCHEVFMLGCEFWPEWRGREKPLKEGLDSLIEATADNENSMARDRRLGRRTEADYLSGHVRSVPAFAARFPLLAALDAQLAEIHEEEDGA